jgi:Bacterial Ig domain/Gametolysin peptidase M11
LGDKGREPHRLSCSAAACWTLASLLCACALGSWPQPAAAAITRSGTLQATVIDDFRSGRSVTTYRLRSGRQQTTPLRPTELAAEPGDRVTVTGTVRDGRLVGAVEATSASAGIEAVAPGPRKVAVVLVTFGGGEPWSSEEARSEVFTAPNSVNAFYREESYGEISLTGKLRSDGDVFGWFGLDTPTAGCPYTTWKARADEAAAAAGVDLSGYQHLIYEFPHQSSCSWLGIASGGGNWSMINGQFFGSRRQVTAHELGHNLGLLHAGSWTCRSAGARVQISDECTAAEYGDPFDTMGNIGFRHNNGWNLAKLGILGPENVETIDASGTYPVRSALHWTSEPTVLRVPRTRTLAGAVSSWYYLELRERGGVFEDVTDASTTGVSIRATAAGSSPETLLLDASPSTTTFLDAPLEPGGTFDGGPVRIRTLSAGAGAATVSVELDEEPPTAPSGLTATAGAEEVQLHWEAGADEFGVHHYVVFRDGTEVGTTESTDLLDSPVSLGEHEYVVYAEDASGNRSAASEPATVTVVPDEAPPTAPTDLTATAGAGGVQLQWSASSDDFGVDRYFVFRDGNQIESVRNTGYLDSIVSAGEHEYVVYAEDASGNRSAASEPATATVPEISGPTCDGGSCTVVYRYSGAPATWAVPPGVGAAEFVVEGARGGSDNPGSIFGAGGRVVATIDSLAAGEEATVSVGGSGRSYAEGSDGGFNGGGDGTLGGGGGGFSSVTIGGSLKLLAGGGGGDGLDGFDPSAGSERGGGRGGRGGSIGTPGGDGVATEAYGATLEGGEGGAQGGSFEASGRDGAGGTGGEVTGASACPGGAAAGGPGGAGDGFAGGGAAPSAGGGGGGGYFGGGQGGGGASDECDGTAGSGGGGGGSSFAAEGIVATFTGGIRRGDGQVSIAYANPIGAAEHSYSTERDRALIVPAASGVLSGAALEPGSLSASVATPPANGALTLDADGSFTYLPAPGYVGGDSFVYRAVDTAGDYATAGVALTVAPPLPEPRPSPPDEDEDDAEAPAPVPVIQLPPPLPVPVPPVTAIGTGHARVVAGIAKVRLACRGGAAGSVCRGALSLSTANRSSKRAGRARYAIPSGRTRMVAVRLRAAALRRIRRSRYRILRVRASVAAAGQSSYRPVVLHLHTRRSGRSPVRKRRSSLR